MKKFIIFSIFFLAFGLKLFSQQISRYALSSGGGDFTSIDKQNIQFTIGQSYNTYTLTDNNTNFLTQGYQQPSFNIGGLLPDLDSVSKIDVYPNPAFDYTNLELNLIDDDGATVSLFDMWGQVIKSQNYVVGKGFQKLQFRFGFVAIGIYTLKVNANKKVYVRKLLVFEPAP